MKAKTLLTFAAGMGLGAWMNTKQGKSCTSKAGKWIKKKFSDLNEKFNGTDEEPGQGDVESEE